MIWPGPGLASLSPSLTSSPRRSAIGFWLPSDSQPYPTISFISSFPSHPSIGGINPTCAYARLPISHHPGPYHAGSSTHTPRGVSLLTTGTENCRAEIPKPSPRRSSPLLVACCELVAGRQPLPYLYPWTTQDSLAHGSPRSRSCRSAFDFVETHRYILCFPGLRTQVSLSY